jgi:hypothetical protein
MILFYMAVMLNMSLFAACSKSTKNKFIGSFVILCCAFIMLQVLYHSSNSSCLISLISVESCRYSITIL